MRKKTSMFKGVSKVRGGWITKVREDGITKYLGFSKDETDAAIIYDDYVSEHWEEMHLNFPHRNGLNQLNKK